MDERAEIASACMLRFKFSFPMVLNNLSDDVEKAYIAMPARVYISDAFGTVTWKCGLGPHPFDLMGFEKNKRSLIINVLPSTFSKRSKPCSLGKPNFNALSSSVVGQNGLSKFAISLQVPLATHRFRLIL